MEKNRNKLLFFLTTFIIGISNVSALSTSTEYINCGGLAIPSLISPITRTIMALLQIVVPLIIILVASFDFVKSVTGSSEEVINSAKKKLVRRLGAGFLVFMVITIIKIVTGFIADEPSSLNKCLDCFVSTKDSCGEVTIAPFTAEYPEQNQVFVPSFFQPPLREDAYKKKPVVASGDVLVYIYNTHQSEEFGKSSDTTKKLGPYLKEAIEKTGVKAVFEEQNISANYTSSREKVKAAMKKYPTIKYTIDLHRDDIPKKSNGTVLLGGFEYAKYMFVVAGGASNASTNKEFVSKIISDVKSSYPTLNRYDNGIYPGHETKVFNQDLAKTGMLIEVGGQHNTFEEAKRTVAVVGNSIGKLIKEAEGIKSGGSSTSGGTSSNGESSTNKASKTMFVGDSRTVGMCGSGGTGCNTSDWQGNKLCENSEVIACGSKGYNWFDSTAISQITNKVSSGGYNIVLWWGVNDLHNVDKYINKYKLLAGEDWNKNNLIITTVGDIRESQNGITQNSIDTFNSKIKSSLGTIKNIKICDVASGVNMEKSDYTDFVHYSKSGYQKVYNYIINNCK